MEPTETKNKVQPCVVLLNGFPGVGKFTIAKSLQSALTDDFSVRLVDNHVLIDISEAIEPGRTDEHYALRKKIRDVAFDALATLRDDKILLIMTACLSQVQSDIDQYHEYASIARARRVPLFTVNLQCDAKTNMERVCSVERRAGRVVGKMKLIDADILAGIRRSYVLLDLQGIEEVGMEAFHLDLDVSSTCVEEATRWILAFLHNPRD